MPRWASRITLEVTDVRVQRIQEISEEDARAEGCDPYCMGEGFVAPGSEHAQVGAATYREGFMMLWDSINARRGHPWAANDRVWCVSFRRLASCAPA